MAAAVGCRPAGETERRVELWGWVLHGKDFGQERGLTVLTPALAALVAHCGLKGAVESAAGAGVYHLIPDSLGGTPMASRSCRSLPAFRSA